MHPLSKAVKLAGVGVRAGLHKLFPFLFSPPVFFMVQVRMQGCIVFSLSALLIHQAVSNRSTHTLSTTIPFASTRIPAWTSPSC